MCIEGGEWGGGTEYVTGDNEECNIAASADTDTWGQ